MGISKSLAETAPEISLQWDYKKNEPATPESVTGQSKSKAWWLCPKGHSFSASIKSRVNRKSGCPVCANRLIVPGFNDLESLEPQTSLEWHPTKNGELLPRHVSRGSEKKVWWKCAKGHEWETSPNHRTSERTGCPFCSNKRVLSGFNDLQTSHPTVAADWDWDKNEIETPKTVNGGSHRRVWWKCKFGHSWQAGIVRRTREDTGCPVCSNNVVLEGANDIASTNPELIPEWDFELNGTLYPKTLGSGSGTRVWWRCSLGHSWRTSPSKRISGQGCPVCIGKKVQVGFNDLLTTNPELASEWNFERNLPLEVTSVTAMANKFAWWMCIEGHEWKSLISNRSGGRGCPKCAKRGFDQASPGTFYFIQHDELFARKVGIANQTSIRLSTWQKRGWTVLWRHESINGNEILSLETKVLRWIRKDLGLPPHLGVTEMGSIGGWSETFSYEGVSNDEIISKIETTLDEIRR